MKLFIINLIFCLIFVMSCSSSKVEAKMIKNSSKIEKIVNKVSDTSQKTKIIMILMLPLLLINSLITWAISNIYNTMISFLLFIGSFIYTIPI